MKKLSKQYIPLPESKPCLSPRFEGSKMSRILTHDYFVSYKYDDGSSFQIKVPAGYEYDASIPKLPLIRILIGAPYDPDLEAASCIHDWLYQTHFTDRKTADNLFQELLFLSGVSGWRRVLMFQTLRMFGGIAWEISEADRKYTRTMIEAIACRGQRLADFKPVFTKA